MAHDQRYCLACGARRSGAHAILSGPPEPAAVTVLESNADPVYDRGPDALLVAGVACVLLALLVGVLIGRSGGDTERAAVPPQVITVAGAATPADASSGAPAAFASDWAAGKKGFTVSLRNLSKEGTDAAAVAAAKQAASDAGAPDVGALDSDDHASLDPGSYVIYAGTFATRKDAADTLPQLKADFPGAKVIEVSSGASAAAGGKSKAPSAKQQAAGAEAIQDLEQASPQEYQKKSADLPDELTTPGKLPPKDDKPAGAGSDSETFE